MRPAVEMKGNEEVEALLQQLAQRAQEMRPAMEEIGNYLQNVIEESFESGRAPDGTVWTPLADSTLDRKHRDGGMQSMGKLLYEEGTLFEGIGYDADGSSVAVGVNAYSKEGYPYPVVLNFGTEDGKLPARRFMPFDENGELDDNVREEVVDLLVDFLSEG